MSLASGTVFADVILPLAIRQNYTFSVPEAYVPNLQTGLRVEVQFGRNKHYTGIVSKLYGKNPGHKTKPILSVIDVEPVVTEKQLALWRWMASYYACTLGEVMNAGLPSHLKLTSETIITLGPLFSDDATQLDDQEYMIVEALTLQNQLSLKDVRDILQKKTVYPVIRRLLDRRIVFLQEELRERYRPKIVRCVRFTENFQTEEQRVQAFDLTQRSEHQTKILLEFLQVSRTLPFVRPADLTKRTGAPDSALKAMAKKGIFEFYEREISRIGGAEEATLEQPELSEQQIRALTQVRSTVAGGKPALIHGVTGSGKTRVYLEVMQEVMAAGSQVLYLLPEIALTGQIVQRLQRVLGDKITVYHSRLNNMERVEIWKAVLAGKTSVVGPRSALFLPFSKLGLVVIDEEHDPSYKQHEPNPRYNGRDVAVYL
ncbi:MAG: DEAD/DEAH box helicase, partial [Bacteroidota bacterium]